MAKHLLRVASTTARVSSYSCRDCEFLVAVSTNGAGHNVLNAGDASVRHSLPRLGQPRVRPATAGPFNLGP